MTVPEFLQSIIIAYLILNDALSMSQSVVEFGWFYSYIVVDGSVRTDKSALDSDRIIINKGQLFYRAETGHQLDMLPYSS